LRTHAGKDDLQLTICSCQLCVLALHLAPNRPPTQYIVFCYIVDIPKILEYGIRRSNGNVKETLAVEHCTFAHCHPEPELGQGGAQSDLEGTEHLGEDRQLQNMSILFT